MSAGIASLVLQLSAFFTIFLGAWVFKEALTKYQLLGIVIALGGLISIIFISDGSVTLPGLAMVVFGAVSWSVANIINKKASTKQVFAFLVWSSAFSPLPLFFLDVAVNGTAGFTAFAHQVNVTSVLSILFQVYPNTLFAYWVWNSLLKQYPVSTVAPLSLLVPIFGLLGSVLIFNESVPATKLLALGLVIIGLTVGLYGKRIRNALTQTAACY